MFYRNPCMLGAEEEIADLTARLGDIARRVEVLEQSKAHMVATLESGTIASPFLRTNMEKRLADTEQQLASLYEEAGLLTEQIQNAQGGEALTAEQINRLQEEAASREWMDIAQKSGLTEEQIAAMKKWGGPTPPPSAMPDMGRPGMGTWVMAGIAAVAAFFLLNR